MNEQRPIRLLIAEDYEIYRMAIVGLLARHGDIEVVAEVEDGNSAIDKATELEPDVALLDYGLPRFGGEELVRKVLECSPRTRVVMMSGYVDEEMETVCRSAGAVACVLKSGSGDDLHKLIVDAMNAN